MKLSPNHQTQMKLDLTLLANLIVGIIGIYGSYITAGLLNERIIKKPYMHTDQNQSVQYFDSTLVFIFFTTNIPWIFGYLIQKFTIKQVQRTQIPAKNSITCAVIILISTFSYINSIFYASFPIATLFKSCNLLSVVLVGVCCSRVKQKGLKLQSKKILIAALITIGLIVFKLTDPQAKQGDQKTTQTIGIAFLIVSLIADGFLPDFQAQIKIKYKPKPIQMMTQNNKWVCIFSFFLLLISNKLTYMLEFCQHHTDFLFHITVMGLLATVGQIFVYWTIKNFKQHIVPFIITTRKITTSGLSLVVYNHTKSWGQILSIGFIFLIVLYEFSSELRVKKQAYTQVNVTQQGQTMKEDTNSNNRQKITEITSNKQIIDDRIQT